MIISLMIAAGILGLPLAAFGSASLGISPATGTILVNGSKTVSVAINTGDQAINSVQASITFPTDQLEVTSISKGSILTLWTAEPSYSNSSGVVSFSGGVPSPGYQGHGTLLNITFKAKVSGSSTVSIIGGVILANDGRGTNVYGGANGATYTISAAAANTNTPVKTTTPTEESEEEDVEIPTSTPVITSKTHPNTLEWYNDTNPHFDWEAESNVTQYSWVLDHEPETVPDDTIESSGNTTEFSDLADGIWYFHLKAGNSAGWGNTAHYQIQVDATSPDALLLNLPDDYYTQDRQPELNFHSQDDLSGIAFYSILVDGKTLVEQMTPAALTGVILNELSLGKHLITVQATDEAGNRTEALIQLNILDEWPIAGFTLGKTFIKYPLALALLAIVVILLLTWLGIFYLLHKKRDICIGDCHIRSCPHFNDNEDHCQVGGRLKRHKKLKKHS